MKKSIFAAILGLSLCFAQGAPERLAVYVSGSENAGVNKSLSSKLLSAMTQGGRYAEIADPSVFQDELAKGGNVGIAQAAQAARRHGADYVCVVGLTEAFGTYSIAARLVRASDAQPVKAAYAERPLRSISDLTAVSGEIAGQLLPPGSKVLSPPPVAAAPPPAGEMDAPPAAPKQCERTYNINELLFKIKDGFPTQLKDCSSKLAKDMLTPASFGGHKLEPVSFMKQCPVDGLKNELPEGFPNADKILGSVTNFVGGILNSAMAGGAVDPKKLVSVIGSMDIMGLVSDVKKAAADECVVDEPYEPPASAPAETAEKEDGGEESSVSFGIRIGFNFSHTYAEYESWGYGYNGYSSGDYGDIPGMQAGFVVDFPLTSWFHIQPGLMYIRKGMDGGGGSITSHNIELPLLLSLKLSALRLSAGPYFSYCLASDNGYFDDFDIGLSTGIGFDIGKFYIGAFYDYGFYSNYYSYMSYSNGFHHGSNNFYNRTLGFNFGVNL